MHRRSLVFAAAIATALALVDFNALGQHPGEFHPGQLRSGQAIASPAGQTAGGLSAAKRVGSVSSLPLAPASGTSRDTGDVAVPSTTADRGATNQAQATVSVTHLIFSYVNSVNPVATVAALPSTVRGVSWLVGWKDVEPNAPVNGVHTYSWSRIDADLAAAAASGRPSMVRVIAGQLSPSWVTPTVTFTMQQPAQTVTMPVPWSSNFITNWTAFISAYGARYKNDSRIWAIQMAGAGRQGEMSLGDWAGWTSTAPPPTGMGSDPATDAKLINAWNTIIDSYRAAFPLKASALDLGDPLGDGQVQSAVMAHAETYGSLVYFQQNGLHSALKGMYPGLLATASATTTVGWQMTSGGVTPTELLGSFLVAISSHATYVEVYQVDCVNPANASALAYFALSR